MVEETQAYLAKEVGPVLRPILAKAARERPEDVPAFLLEQLKLLLPNAISEVQFGEECLFNEFYPAGDSPHRMARPGEGQEIDAAWLSGALNCTVRSFDCKAAAEGQTGVTFMITNIVYEGSPVRASSYAIKMHALAESGRGFAVSSKFYDKELYFFNPANPIAKKMASLDFEIPKVFAMFKDRKVMSETFGDETGCSFFNLIMEDLNDKWAPYSSIPGKTPPLEDHVAFMQKFKSMHVEFFKWGDPEFTSPPLSFSGAAYKWLDWKPLIDMASAAWPAVRENMPKLSKFGDTGTEHGFPSKHDKIIDLFDRLCCNDGKGAKQLLDEVNKIWATRPMSIVHGDLNSGNVWKGKNDGSKYLLADWQCCRMGPIGFDFLTQLVTTDAFNEAGSIKKFMKDYHDTLPANMQQEYSSVDMEDDCRLTSITFVVGIQTLMAGQIAGYADMPEDKRNFTWEIFWPTVFDRFLNICEQLDCYDFSSKLAGV